MHSRVSVFDKQHAMRLLLLITILAQSTTHYGQTRVQRCNNLDPPPPPARQSPRAAESNRNRNKNKNEMHSRMLLLPDCNTRIRQTPNNNNRTMPYLHARAHGLRCARYYRCYNVCPPPPLHELSKSSSGHVIVALQGNGIPDPVASASVERRARASKAKRVCSNDAARHLPPRE